MQVVLSVTVTMVDLSVSMMPVTLSVAIMQFGVSATLIPVTVSTANMWVTIFIMQVGVCCYYALGIFCSTLCT